MTQNSENVEIMEGSLAGDIQHQPNSKMIFGIHDRPPIHIAFFYGLQVNDLSRNVPFPTPNNAYAQSMEINP